MRHSGNYCTSCIYSLTAGALFEDAEREQAERGVESKLHIIIFDEVR